MLIYPDPLRHPIRGRGKGQALYGVICEGPRYSRGARKATGPIFQQTKDCFFLAPFSGFRAGWSKTIEAASLNRAELAAPVVPYVTHGERAGPLRSAQGAPRTTSYPRMPYEIAAVYESEKPAYLPCCCAAVMHSFFYFSILFEARRKRVGEKAATPASRAPDMRTYLFLYLTFLNIREEMRSSYLQHPRFKSPKAL